MENVFLIVDWCQRVLKVTVMERASFLGMFTLLRRKLKKHEASRTWEQKALWLLSMNKKSLASGLNGQR